jgi:hypothetical protein
LPLSLLRKPSSAYVPVALKFRAFGGCHPVHSPARQKMI